MILFQHIQKNLIQLIFFLTYKKNKTPLHYASEESLEIVREGLARRSQIEEIIKKLKEEKAKIKKLEAIL